MGAAGKILRHAAAMLFFACLTVVMTELVLRLQAPDAQPVGAMGGVHQASQTPGLDYELRPNHSAKIATEDFTYELRTNGLGMRDDEPASGAQYVAAVGDSVTYGWGVERDETFVAHIEAALNAGDRAALDVLNFGVSGYAAPDAVAVVEHKALPFRPKAILLSYVLNDPKTFAFDPLRLHFLPWTAPEQFELGQTWFRMQRNFQMKRLGTADHFAWLHAEGLPAWGTVLDSFDRIRDAAAETPVVVAVFPFNREATWAEYGYREIHRQVAEAARERGFLTVDLLPVFEQHPPLEVRISEHDEHPTPLGHRIAAEALLPALREALGEEPAGDLDTVSAAWQ